jgi:hypothetical protein
LQKVTHVIVLDAVQPAATVSGSVEVAHLTSPRTSTTKPRAEAPSGLFHPRRFLGHTEPDVDPIERGSEDERNQASATEADRNRSAREERGAEDGAGSKVRSELARELLNRVDGLLALVGDVSLAAHVGLLKRDLSRCHDALHPLPAESNFLSIVTLVESAMAQLKWKDYTKAQLEAIRAVFDVGYRRPRVRFEDYEAARSQLAQKKVEATPRIDLESLSWDDVSDEEG